MKNALWWNDIRFHKRGNRLCNKKRKFFIIITKDLVTARKPGDSSLSSRTQYTPRVQGCFCFFFYSKTKQKHKYDGWLKKYRWCTAAVSISNCEHRAGIRSFIYESWCVSVTRQGKMMPWHMWVCECVCVCVCAVNVCARERLWVSLSLRGTFRENVSNLKRKSISNKVAEATSCYSATTVDEQTRQLTNEWITAHSEGCCTGTQSDLQGYNWPLSAT